MILEGILKVYNFLSHFFSDDNIAHILLGIYINSPNLIFPKSKWAEDIIALFVSPSIDKQQFSCIFIDVVNYWEQDYNEFYHRGHYAANYNDYGIIVHELGHTLAFLLLMISNPIHATSFNRNLKTVGDCKKINSEITFLDTNFSNYDPKTTYEYIFTEILYRKIVNITSTASSLAISSVKRRLALFTALPSKYGWKYNELLSTSNYFEGEYFAEAFSYWLLTPINQRNYYWELINDSFQEAFQKAKGL
ncbi:hypothetical protein [Spiroplasma endosymbiont of Eupeodes luniger]|uniref:hypothetical protein n=1 Tax=Spiroplasma endosymbiont of Eupeodes luniger TaxID=3066300 RepID=UPI0030D5FFE7